MSLARRTVHGFGIACLCAVPGILWAQGTAGPASVRAADQGGPRLGVACQGGVFVLEAGGRAAGLDGLGSVAIEVFNGQAAILGVTEPVPAHLTLSRQGTEVHARWVEGEGLPHGARVDAVIEPSTCSAMTGVLQAPGVFPPRPFLGRSRLLSADGTVGGGDGGDPDGGASGNTGGHKGFQRWYAQVAPRAVPQGAIPSGALEKGYGQIVLAPIAPVRWVSLGPAPQRAKPGDPTESPRSITSGRVDALAVDPADPAHWLVGAATGGVWETRDAGATWAPRTDDQPSLAISALAFSPSAPNVAYAGTGPYSPLGDSGSGS